MTQQPLKPRGQRATTVLGTGVLIALAGLGAQSLGASTGVAMIFAGIGSLVVIAGGVYWIVMMIRGRGG